ncbi:hypothetical protein [Ructibacterium gallinarum]|uniref:Uncharacterized protein n=1 Tax=Ructibacterium gallinarum TaxID=2779355 RepID=A0A9D5R7H6_9FIRM|nr:hypothetical protein [Ructibacterium gallinarum]MBE5039191.1 hypothetical protein [Ructibacterium gallinarum]
MQNGNGCAKIKNGAGMVSAYNGKDKDGEHMEMNGDGGKKSDGRSSGGRRHGLTAM